MTILFAGTEEDATTRVSGVPTAETNAARRDANFVRAAHESLAASVSSQIDFEAQTDLWFHFDYVLIGATGAADGSMFEFIDVGAAQVVVRLWSQDASHYLEYWNGASFTRMTVPLPHNRLYYGDNYETVDIHIKLHDTLGEFQFFVNNTLVTEFTGDTLLYTPTDNINQMKWRGVSNDYNTTSQIIVADEPTIGMKCATLYPTADGANIDFSGTYADIDESVVYDDATLASSTVANDISTYVVSDLSAIAQDYDVKAVVVSARMKASAGAPENAQMALRTNSTNYFGGTLSGLSASFAPLQEIWETNPDTAAVWTVSEVQALEGGVKSIT
jgi:hypothetical protein